MQSLQDAARHATLEDGGIAEMPFMPKGSCAPPVHMIKLTQMRQIMPHNNPKATLGESAIEPVGCNFLSVGPLGLGT